MSTIQAVVGAYLRVMLVISWYFVIIYMQYFLYLLSMLKNLPGYQKIVVCGCFYLQYKRIIHMILCQIRSDNVRFCLKSPDYSFSVALFVKWV